MGLRNRDEQDDVDVDSCLANLDRLTTVRESGPFGDIDLDSLTLTAAPASEMSGVPQP